MRLALALASAFLMTASVSANAPEGAPLYLWDAAPTELKDGHSVRAFINGATLDMGQLMVEGITLEPDATIDGSDSRHEQLYILKEGSMTLTLRGESQTLGPGSMALVHPGDDFAIANRDSESATFYRFRYRSKEGPNPDRAAAAGGSFLVDWNAVEYLPSQIGGRRNNFDRPTAMLPRFEMHASTLNSKLTNHPAHTHRAEEMVLVLRGRVEMLIGDSYYQAGPGDFYFIEANALHALRNIGDETTEYLAFQWM